MMGAREQIKSIVMKVMDDAENAGRDPMMAARQAFPDFPEGALWECWAEWDTFRMEAWWRSMEKTIDAEAVNDAARLVGGRS